METPGALEVARIPDASIPVCVVSRCMYTSVAKCVLRRTHSMDERGCVRATPCAKETPCVDETPGMSETACVEATPCVSGVVTSVPGCVLHSTPCMSETLCMDETPRVSAPACVSGMACVSETARMSERPSVRETSCVRSLYVREMTVGMREHAAASPGVSGMSCCVSVVTHRSACVEWSLSARMRRRRRQTRYKGRVAAVVALGTAPGLHGGEREVRAVQRKRPPRARLRE